MKWILSEINSRVLNAKGRDIIDDEQETDYWVCLHELLMSNFSQLDSILISNFTRFNFIKKGFLSEKESDGMKKQKNCLGSGLRSCRFECFFVGLWLVEMQEFDWLAIEVGARQQCQCREDQTIQEVRWLIESLAVVIYNLKFQNHTSIVK